MLSPSEGFVRLPKEQFVYLPERSAPQLSSLDAPVLSFSAPIVNLHDTHLSTPLFGANGWVASVQPVTGGGLPPAHMLYELKLTFKDGGAFDFHSAFERIKEVHTNARANGQSDVAAAPLEQLPAYEDSSSAPLVQQGQVETASPTSPVVEHGGRGQAAGGAGGAKGNGQEGRREQPTEPPPGYEEVQRESVASELERRLRGS
ncbi:MAG: hypothetical protein M1814_006820 [Vezdaea aestivalis]|nr:MAG: hypothetical protein M1814_006820 [Vezdaea aestivalis]